MYRETKYEGVMIGKDCFGRNTGVQGDIATANGWQSCAVPFHPL
jgi:hypothetical protein